jgi:activating signal cointegrator complex subunit 3
MEQGTPRLSSRLLLSLYGLQTSTPEELNSQRKVQLEKALSSIGNNGDNKISFSIERFLNPSSQHAVPAETVTQINNHFKAYLEVLSQITSDAVLHKNAAFTMFNIVTKSSSKEKAYSDAKSYFGFFDRELFNRAVVHATALEDLSSQAKQGSGSNHHSDFGADLEFEVPSSSIDTSLFLRERDIYYHGVGDDEEESCVSKPAAAASSFSNSTDASLDLSWFDDAINQHLALCPSAWNRDQFRTEIVRICRESKMDGDLEGRLFELIGESNLEFLMMIVQNADTIKNYVPPSSKSTSAGKVQQQQPAKVLKSADYVSSQSAAFENLSANQKKKVLQREQKELEMILKASEAAASESGQYDFLQKLGFNEEYLKEERALGLQKNRTFESWTENLAPPGTREYYEKRGLPAGATRTIGNGLEEVFIPAAKRPPPPGEGELVSIETLDEWARPAFAGTKHLNRIQSAVYPCAYFSSENMLVCAPTGAGKTNIAMLTLLQLAKLFMDDDGVIDKASMKAIYIAPMKALAQEVVTKFSERLAPLGLVVKEYTGDMQLTKQEITEANLLVCTPEKYDVATRKGGDGSLGTLVSLIIIDEVHLLADERGAVIETIVARTQRYVESSQRIVRIVGLSATLPNYQDVATFLRVNANTGLYFFGPEFRPIPLDQTFVGVTEKQRVKRNTVMNKVAYDKMVAALDAGKQVMIFVHSRKDTSRTLESILELCAKYGTFDRLENAHHEKYTIWKREVDKSKSQEVQNLFYKGVGVHHAGMLRSDRTLVEQLFECGLIKVLCCTATLAWGVNLPAHTVIIKGTEMYDPERGGFVDLSILDVLQIFGRAGRPQYDNSGHAILITPHKSLALYLGMLAHQAPIESALIKALPDHLNAEIVNGTVNNIKEAAAWLSYTFLFVRMRQNPLIYGMTYEETFVDPQLENKRMQLVREAADTLDTCMMTRYDKRSGNLAVTDLGRIASHYYIKHTTVQSFNNMLAPHLSDPDAVHVLCSSAEFDQLKVRPEELSEIDQLKKHSFWNIKSTSDDTAGKVSVLLQGYLSHARLTSFTLQSDTNYVAQNAGRIARALFEICLKRGWSTMARYYLCLCNSIDRRVRMDHNPLRQFPDLPFDILKKLEDADASYEYLVDMDSREIGQLIHNQKFGPKVKELVHKLPMLSVEAKVQPITRGIIRMTINLASSFDWVDRYHGQAEPFWIWIEDGENEYVYHSEYFILIKKQKNEVKTFEVTIPVRDPLPPQYYIRVMSDVWVGCETVTTVSFQHVMMPTMMANAHTDLLDLHPLPRTALQNPLFEDLYPFSHFNPIQTQTFHVLYNTDRNVLVGAPTGKKNVNSLSFLLFG